nr:tetraspanin-8-like [Nicotiana tomentosiformis]
MLIIPLASICNGFTCSHRVFNLADWLHFNGSVTLCQKVFQKPLLILGISLLVVSVLGLVGSCCRVTFFLWIYLFLLFLLIVGLLCFSVFAILVTNKNVSRALSGRGYMEAKFGDYSHWLQKYVVNAENWEEIKSCLVDTKFCQRLPPPSNCYCGGGISEAIIGVIRVVIREIRVVIVKDVI